MPGGLSRAADAIVASRRKLYEEHPIPIRTAKCEEEGGCGVVGFASDVPVAGRHIIRASEQMHNRGNGKGGGVAALGLVPEELGVPRETLDEDYILQIALLDPACESEVESRHVEANFKIDEKSRIAPARDWRELKSLDVPPPVVIRYFVRARPDALARLSAKMPGLSARAVEDELVYQSSFALNRAFYASLGEKRAFVLSHARNLIVLKIVGYAEDVARYYGLEDLHAHAWIAHQRYPTKGRVWHPGGAHPFIGLNEALVHNGDFANYHSVGEYLAQRGIHPMFLTDTEVSVQLFDLWSRVYGYPLEAVIEAMAPTTERDFQQLPEAKRALYRAIQASHIHGSPDGPWFFIIARNDVRARELQLIGITDTSMLRPQVFALVQGESSFGFIASEKQAIDATLQSIADEDPSVPRSADMYWNARGGSHTDGGAFVFAIGRANDRARLSCRDKFGKEILTPPGQVHASWPIVPARAREWQEEVLPAIESGDSEAASRIFALRCAEASYEELAGFVDTIARFGAQPRLRESAREALTRILDIPVITGVKKASSVRQIVEQAIVRLFQNASAEPDILGMRLDARALRRAVPPPATPEAILYLDCAEFAPEGEQSAARAIVDAYARGWKRFVTFNWKGQRFAGCGLGAGSNGVIIDVYGSSGDYLASGADGCEIRVHGNGQDQLGQIFKAGKLVVYGDVGQTFFYGAKGGTAYVMGNAAGRPLINAVGRPRVVINGTCLDYLAESFMAGDPLNGGGFVILNGIRRDHDARMVDLETPYPGGNLFSLASGGAIYIRDPHGRVEESQLNGGRLVGLRDADWEQIHPYLMENERLFAIPVESLLTVGGSRRPPADVYRKVEAVPLGVLGFSQSYTGT